MMHPDDEGFTYASDAEWDRAAASELGGVNPNQAWILTDRDVWYKNPYYHGPAVRHPEEEDHEDEVFADEPSRFSDLPFPF